MTTRRSRRGLSPPQPVWTARGRLGVPPQHGLRREEGGAEIALPLSRASALKAAFTRSRSEFEWCSYPAPCRRKTARRRTGWTSRGTATPPTTRSCRGRGAESARQSRTPNTGGTPPRSYDPWNPWPYTITPGTSGPVWVTESNGGGFELSLVGRRYWPVLRRASLGLGATVAVSRDSSDSIYAQGDTVRTMGQSGSGARGRLEAELIGVPGRLGRGATQMWWVVRASAWVRPTA